MINIFQVTSKKTSLKKLKTRYLIKKPFKVLPA